MGDRVGIFPKVQLGILEILHLLVEVILSVKINICINVVLEISPRALLSCLGGARPVVIDVNSNDGYITPVSLYKTSDLHSEDGCPPRWRRIRNSKMRRLVSAQLLSLTLLCMPQMSKLPFLLVRFLVIRCFLLWIVNGFFSREPRNIKSEPHSGIIWRIPI